MDVNDKSAAIAQWKIENEVISGDPPEAVLNVKVPIGRAPRWKVRGCSGQNETFVGVPSALESYEMPADYKTSKEKKAEAAAKGPGLRGQELLKKQQEEESKRAMEKRIERQARERYMREKEEVLYQQYLEEQGDLEDTVFIESLGDQMALKKHVCGHSVGPDLAVEQAIYDACKGPKKKSAGMDI